MVPPPSSWPSTSDPDLILLDVQMPVMDGVQTLAALKGEPRTQKIPVIIVTTLGRQKDRDILLKGGAAGCPLKAYRWSGSRPQDQGAHRRMRKHLSRLGHEG